MGAFAVKDVMRSPRAKAAVRFALDEDLGNASALAFPRWLDATSEALVDPDAVATGEIYPKGKGCVVAGATVARAVLKAVDPRIQVRITVPDGAKARVCEPILVFRGKARSILAAERTALNFMQRMCATATLTRAFVDATKRYGTLILDTRKTTPGLRVFEKYAVLCGGGANHRMGMYDRVLMKDNHRRLWKGGDPSALDEAVRAARAKFPRLAVEVEVESLEECASARLRPGRSGSCSTTCPSPTCAAASGCAAASRRPRRPAASRLTARARLPRPESRRFRSAASPTRPAPPT